MQRTRIEPLRPYYRNEGINSAVEALNLYVLQLYIMNLSANDDVAALEASPLETNRAKAATLKAIKNQYKELNRNIITSLSLNLLRALSKVMIKAHITESLGFYEELNRVNRILPETRNIQDDLKLIVAQRVEGALAETKEEDNGEIVIVMTPAGLPGAAAFLASKGEKQRLTVNLAAKAQQLLFHNFDNLDLAHFIPALADVRSLLERDGLTRLTPENIRLLSCAGKIDRLAEQIFNISSRVNQILTDLTLGFPEDILEIMGKMPGSLLALYAGIVSVHGAQIEATAEAQEALKKKILEIIKKTPTSSSGSPVRLVSGQGPSLEAQEALANALESQLQELCATFSAQLLAKVPLLEKRTSKMLSNPQAQEIYDAIAVVQQGGSSPRESNTPSPTPSSSRKKSLLMDKSVIKGERSLKQLSAIQELVVVLQGYGKLEDAEIKPELVRRVSPVITPKAQQEQKLPPQRLARSKSLGAEDFQLPPRAQAPKPKIAVRKRRNAVIPEYRPSQGPIEDSPCPSPRGSSISQFMSAGLSSNSSSFGDSGSLKSLHSNTSSQILSSLRIVPPSPRRGAIPTPQESPTTAKSTRSNSRSSKRSLSLSDLELISNLRLLDEEDDQTSSRRPSLSGNSGITFISGSLLASAKDEAANNDDDNNSQKGHSKHSSISSKNSGFCYLSRPLLAVAHNEEEEKDGVEDNRSLKKPLISKGY